MVFGSALRASDSARRTPELRKASSRRRCSSVAKRSEEHTSELQSIMRISYAVFCLTKNNRYPVARQLNSAVCPAYSVAVSTANADIQTVAVQIGIQKY